MTDFTNLNPMHSTADMLKSCVIYEGLGVSLLTSSLKEIDPTLN